MDKEKQLILLGMGMCIGLLIYSGYNIIFFVPEYNLQCRDDFERYDIVTNNFTEYQDILEKCIEYSNNMRKLSHPDVILPYLNFSIQINNTYNNTHR